MEAFLRDNPESLPFKAGDEVEITEGPFAGITAKVFACAESRVLLLFQLMGSMRKLGFLRISAVAYKFLTVLPQNDGVIYPNHSHRVCGSLPERKY